MRALGILALLLAVGAAAGCGKKEREKPSNGRRALDRAGWPGEKAAAARNTGAALPPAEEKLLNSKDAEERNGLLYEANSPTPFTGKVFSHYQDIKRHLARDDEMIIGSRERECQYRDGIKHGKETSWFYDGRKKEEGEWRDGKKNGKWTRFSIYTDGQQKSEIEWREGVEISRIQWDENGNRIE